MSIAEAIAIEPLSARLRQCTQDAHEQAERAAFLTRLLGGELSIHAWAGLLEQYGFIYHALEAAADTIPNYHPATELFVRELDRSEAIAADFDYLTRTYSTRPIGMQPATAAYVDLIRACRGDAVALIAHHYTRYLGDLSGGQAMRVMLERSYGLPKAGSQFFDFSPLAPLPRFKERYRNRLDNLGLTEADAQRLITGANDSFRANQEIFAELDEIYLPAAA